MCSLRQCTNVTGHITCWKSNPTAQLPHANSLLPRFNATELLSTMNPLTPANNLVFDNEKSPTMNTELDAPQVGFVGELYIACCRTFASLIVELALEATSSVKFHAIEELGRLHVWGDGFEAENGGLDKLLDTSEDLRDAVIYLLTGIAHKLERRKLDYSECQVFS